MSPAPPSLREACLGLLAIVFCTLWLRASSPTPVPSPSLAQQWQPPAALSGAPESAQELLEARPTPPAETEAQALARTEGCMVAIGAVCAVVFTCVLATGACREDPHESGVPPPARELEGPELWDDREKLIAYTHERLELESRADLGCMALLFNRPWRKTPGLRVCAPKLCSNKEWCDNKPFPNGETKTECQFSMVIALWRFLARKKEKETRLCCFLMVVAGCCPAGTAQLLACITDEIDRGTWGDKGMLLWYCSLLMIVNIVASRANYVYEVEVPGASVRWELSQRLQRQFLGMRGETAHAWPAGRCAAVISYDVVQATNLTWESLFVLTQSVTGMLSLTAVMIYNNRNTQRMLGTSSIMLFVLFAGAAVNLVLRRPNCLDLARRKRDWTLALNALGTKQVRENRDGKQLRCEDEAAEVFGDAALIYRKRAFHYFFIRLVAGMSCAEMTFVSQAIIAFIAGCETRDHQMSVGQAVALIAVVNLLSVQLTNFVNCQLDIQEGYVSLLDIAQVFNCKELV